MMEPAALQRTLAAFLGGDRFRKFVQQGIRYGKLRYWQEQEWARFTAAHPQFAGGREELAVALRTGAWQDEAWRREKRVALTTALVGGILTGVSHIALVCYCWRLYTESHPDHGLLPYLDVIFYPLLALCLTPLSMLCGAAIGLRFARMNGKQGTGN
jgi:hypothetical protein